MAIPCGTPEQTTGKFLGAGPARPVRRAGVHRWLRCSRRAICCPALTRQRRTSSIRLFPRRALLQLPVSAAWWERSGATTQLEAAATTPLPELRDHPVILLGGYNNQWAMRLLEPLPFHFGSGAEESIVETAPPHARWARDPSLPYSSADDYALLARFRDTTTDGSVVVLAGVGRNGTEAAANFATSPHYMQLRRDQLGSDISNRNIEAVLKVNVIDGKTGAPSILAARTW